MLKVMHGGGGAGTKGRPSAAHHLGSHTNSTPGRRGRQRAQGCATSLTRQGVRVLNNDWEMTFAIERNRYNLQKDAASVVFFRSPFARHV